MARGARRAIEDTERLRTARARFKLANEADTPQQQRERDDLAFYAGEQWPTDIKLARMGQQPVSGMPAVPARPTLVINKVREPVRQIQNQVRGSDIGIELVPADDFGDLGITPDDTEVTLREGLIRRIQRESQAQDARQWAADRAFIAGRGYYLVTTRYLPGKTWDQEVYVHRIYNQAGVLLDPSHESPDGSDAEWEFLGTWVPWERISSEYPVLADGSPSPFSDYNEQDFIAMAESYPDWYRQSYDYAGADGKKSTIKQFAVRVTDYWYVDRKSRELAILDNGESVWVDELPAGPKPKKGKADPLAPEGTTIVDRRTVVEKTITYCKIVGGALIVEETELNGPDMPIVKVMGEELQPYDEQRRAEGMVRPARESNMGFNYMASKAVEVLGLSPIPLLQLDPEAIDGYEAWYGVLNTRTLPYAPYRTYDDQGRELNPPHRLPVDPNILPIMQALSMFDQAVQSTTAVPNPSLGRTDSSVKSAKHADALIAQASEATSNFLDGLARAMRYEGQIENNLLFPIYGSRPGRMVRILTGEGENETMQVGEGQTAQAQQQQKAAKIGKLTKDAKFNVVVKISKNAENRRMQESSALGELIAAEPTMMGWFGDLYFSARDIPNRKQLAERAKVMLAPPIQQMLQAKEQGGQFDPVAAAKIAQMQQQIQELEQIAGRMNEEIKTNQAEQSAKVAIEQGKAQAQAQIEQLKAEAQTRLAQLEAERDIRLEQERAQTELEKARMDNATKMYIADVQAKTKGVIEAQEVEHEAIALAHTTQHEAEQAELDRENMDRQAERQEAEAERDRQFNAGENEANRQATARQSEDAGE